MSSETRASSPRNGWCEIDTAALSANVAAFKAMLPSGSLLAVAVKANAYGHGLQLAAEAFVAGGADWLCVHSVEEAVALRGAGLTADLYILGPVFEDQLVEAVGTGARLVVYNTATIDALHRLGLSARLHLKVETGNNRQGVDLDEALALADRIAACPGLVLEGVSSHFANIEDTTDHRYARQQIARFDTIVAALDARGHRPALRHLSNTAATLLWPDGALDMVRVGIGAYGMWPSKETYIAAKLTGRAGLDLRPALTWKTRIAQIKSVPEGSSVGYGCSYTTTRTTRLAVLPVGYFDGYDRGLSNLAHVLLGGRRAPVRGRVCMNLVMVDVTDIPGAGVGDEVVLLGRQGQMLISAEQLAGWAGTINYEITTRIGGHVPRIRRAAQAVAVDPAALMAARGRPYRP